MWTPDGKSKQGRPKHTTIKRTIINELKQLILKYKTCNHWQVIDKHGEL
jgi:hypothetical protein